MFLLLPTMNVDQIEFNRLTGNRDVLPTFVGICVGLAQTDVANKPDHSLSNEWPRQKKNYGNSEIQK